MTVNAPMQGPVDFLSLNVVSAADGCTFVKEEMTSSAVQNRTVNRNEPKFTGPIKLFRLICFICRVSSLDMYLEPRY